MIQTEPMMPVEANREIRSSALLATTVFDRLSGGLMASVGLLLVLVLILTGIWAQGLLPAGFESRPLATPLPYPDEEMDFEELELDVLIDDEVPEKAFEDLIESIPAVVDTLTEVVAGGETGVGLANHGNGDLRKPPAKTLSHKRWVLEWSADDIEEYSELLEHFGFEIGLVDPETPKIIRLSRLNEAEPSIEESSRSVENERSSIYFVHHEQQFLGWDRRITRRAGLETADKISVIFTSETTRRMLHDLENKFLAAQQIDVSNVEKTRFSIGQNGKQWQIVVSDVVLKD